jgi:hypothetical protein
MHVCKVCCILSVYLCVGKRRKKEGRPSGLVPIWHGVDPAARNIEGGKWDTRLPKATSGGHPPSFQLRFNPPALRALVGTIEAGHPLSFRWVSYYRLKRYGLDGPSLVLAVPWCRVRCNCYSILTLSGLSYCKRQCTHYRLSYLLQVSIRIQRLVQSASEATPMPTVYKPPDESTMICSRTMSFSFSIQSLFFSSSLPPTYLLVCPIHNLSIAQALGSISSTSN